MLQEQKQEQEIQDDDIESDIQYVTTLNENITKYKQYHIHDVEKILITIIYLNCSNQIQWVDKKEISLTQKNYLSNQELVQLITSHSKYQNKRYHIFFVCKYNVIDNDNDNNNNNNNNNNETNNYIITDISLMNDITFQPSIQIFHDLNEILLCFKESNSLQKTKRKKKNNNNNIIKTIFIHSRHKKTRRK
jgi:hypothetical protein